MMFNAPVPKGNLKNHQGLGGNHRSPELSVS